MGSGKIRTGIDLGTGSVKVVRGIGAATLERITHVGQEDWDPPDSGDDTTRAANALQRLLDRLGLGRRKLGRVAVGLGSARASFREVAIAHLSEADLRAALPFEARKHLNLEGMAEPILAFQILGSAPAAENGTADGMRVLFAAVAQEERRFPLDTLSRLALEPEVIDLEPLAATRAVMAHLPDEDAGKVFGLLDLGRAQSVLHVASRHGGFLSRPVGEGHPRGGDAQQVRSYRAGLAERVRETVTFYRGRHRQEVERIFLSGGGALLEGVAEELSRAMGMPVAPFNPFDRRIARAQGGNEVAGKEACFVTAYGLCRWWDAADV